MSEVKIYTVVSDELSPPAIGESFCTDMVRHSDYAALEQKLTDLAVQLANAESKCRELAAVAWIGVNMLKDMQDECRQSGRVWVDDTGLGNCTPLYAAPQLPQPAPEKIAMQNFRASMEGIGHIRRTLDETFGGLRGTHCEPDVLVECKEICDAIYEAYRKTAPVTPDGWQLVPKEPTEAMNKAGWAAINEHDAINPTYRAMLAAAPQQEVKLALEHGMQRYAGAMQKLSEGDK